MRVLIISDIHANLEGLEACLGAAPAHDALANLGDVVGYGASPNEVVELVRKQQSPIVRGNHDRACSGLTDLADFSALAAQAARWTQRALSQDSLAWLRQLPPGPCELVISKNGGVRPLLVHGSPLDEDEYLISLHDGLEVLRRGNIRLTFFGHTHLQGGFALDEAAGGHAFAIRPQYRSSTEGEQYRLKLEPGTRYLINPGSVGQPRDGDWRAGFALFDSDADEVTFFRVPYDLAASQQRILRAGLPERLASRLGEGR